MDMKHFNYFLYPISLSNNSNKSTAQRKVFEGCKFRE